MEFCVWSLELLKHETPNAKPETRSELRTSNIQRRSDEHPIDVSDSMFEVGCSMFSSAPSAFSEFPRLLRCGWGALTPPRIGKRGEGTPSTKPIARKRAPTNSKCQTPNSKLKRVQRFQRRSCFSSSRLVSSCTPATAGCARNFWKTGAVSFHASALLASAIGAMRSSNMRPRLRASSPDDHPPALATPVRSPHLP